MKALAVIAGLLCLQPLASPKLAYQTRASESGALPAVVRPFPSGLSGTLVFHSDLRGPGNPEGRSRIYSLDLAKGVVAALTNGSQWRDENPRWSADGTRIAFKSTRGNGAYDIYVMNADGSNVTRVTDHAANDHDPADETTVVSPPAQIASASTGPRAPLVSKHFIVSLL
ncbi:MAG: hypothetical protein EBU23_17115, partial [Mycobacteriaceae bacterium]|nr:hypothetical protein [Mycobacteriaceae bacterium]